MIKQESMATAFEILAEELSIPKEITIDDIDGTRLGTNGPYISDIIRAMEKYAGQSTQTRNGKCRHEWKPVEMEYNGTTAVCTKCGAED